MSTRGAFGFYVNGETKVTYNNYDSYLEGLGSEIFIALQRFFAFYEGDMEEANNKLKKIAEKIILIDEESLYKPLTNTHADYLFDKKIFKELEDGIITANLVKTLMENKKQRYSFSTMFKMLSEKYATEHNIDFYLFNSDEKLEMKDSKNFLLNGLFCEYAYIINVDDKVLEIYKGGSNGKYSIKPSRYVSDEPLQYGKYGAVDLVAEFSFEDIDKISLSKFLKKANKAEQAYLKKVEKYSHKKY